jgi:hypothetical protein
MNMNAENVKIVTGVPRAGGVSMKTRVLMERMSMGMGMNRINVGMWWGMSRGDDAYEQVIHV